MDLIACDLGQGCVYCCTLDEGGCILCTYFTTCFLSELLGRGRDMSDDGTCRIGVGSCGWQLRAVCLETELFFSQHSTHDSVSCEERAVCGRTVWHLLSWQRKVEEERGMDVTHSLTSSSAVMQGSYTRIWAWFCLGRRAVYGGVGKTGPPASLLFGGLEFLFLRYSLRLTAVKQCADCTHHTVQLPCSPAVTLLVSVCQDQYVCLLMVWYGR